LSPPVFPLVAFVRQRVLGPGDDKALGMHHPPQMTAAQGNPGPLVQVGAQPGDAPDRKDIPATQGAALQHPTQFPAVLDTDAGRPAAARPIRQGGQAAFLPAAADVADGVQAQPRHPGDRSRRFSGRRTQQAGGAFDQPCRVGMVADLPQPP